MLGELIGNHRIVRKLGEGGMGEVYLAEHESIGTQIAVKLLFPHISHELAQVDRFFNEARAVAKIRHAGIVRISDVGFTAGGRAYLLMELLEGEALADRIRRGPLPPPVACEIARQIASVLAATHAAGIVHRDLKPDNVFLVPDLEQPGGERVKILDFGIAKLTGALARGRPTQSQSAMGTPVYMSPEQWGDSSKVDARADIYSLGCIAFEMLVGRPPFDASSMMEAFAMHTTLPPPSARARVVEVPAALDALLLRMLAKTPAERPQTMKELVRAFAELRGGSGILVAGLGAVDPTATPPPSALATVIAPAPGAVDSIGHHKSTPAVDTSLTPARRARRGLRIAIAAMVAVGAGTAAVMVTRGGGAVAAHGGRDAGGAVAVTASPDGGAPPVDAGPAASLREQIEAIDPFVIVGSPPFAAQRGLVSREAYGRFVASLSPADAAARRPLVAEDGVARSAAVTWVTYAQAAAFCRAIDARLPTSAQWATLAADRGGPASVGPIDEWTGPAADGVALVREPRDRAPEPDDPLYLATEAPPGARPETVAGPRIGFRCVR